MLRGVTGHRIYYDFTGPASAPTVCLLHCLSSDSGVWSEQVQPLLAAGWRVLRIDMRGHGGSDVGADEATIGALADDVTQTLDFLEVGRLHLVGLSIGGMIAQAFAVAHSNRLESLLLTGTSPRAVPGGIEMWKARFTAIEQAGSLDPIADATMERWVTDKFRASRPNRWEQIRSTIAATSPKGYRAGAEAIINFDIVSRLPAITTATLVLCGDQDSGTPPAENRLIAETVPGARYRELEGARHLPMVEYPQLFSNIMLEWLQSKR